MTFDVRNRWLHAGAIARYYIQEELKACRGEQFGFIITVCDDGVDACDDLRGVEHGRWLKVVAINVHRLSQESRCKVRGECIRQAQFRRQIGALSA